MSFIDTIQDAQARSIEGIRSAQEQVLSFNEQIAGTAQMPAMPELPGPLAALPTPTELAENYFGFLGQLHEANKEFALRLLAPWGTVSEED